MNVTQTALDREMLLVPVTRDDLRGFDAMAEPRGRPDLLPDESPGQPPALQTNSAAFVVRSALIVLAMLTIGLVIQLVWVTGLEHRSAQVALFNRFRSELALGTAPIGPTGTNGRALALGTPIALLSIPSIGLKQVVVEGTTGSVLAKVAVPV